MLYEVQVFATVESTTSVTGTTVVDFREVSVDMTEINTAIETAAIQVRRRIGKEHTWNLLV